MEIIRLKDLCTVDITDGTHQTPTYCKTGFIFLSSKNVTSQTIDWNDVKYIPKELHDELHKRVAPQKNDILLAKNGTTGIAAMVEEDLIFDIYVSLALIRPNTKIVLPRYLLYAINNPITKRYFDSHLKGIGVPNLHLTHIKETPIVLYEIPIQQKIVRLLDKVSDLIAKRRAQLDKLDLLVKARFVEIFGTEHELGRWPCGKVADVADVCVGVVIKPTQYYAEEGVRAFRSLNIGPMYVKDNDWIYFSQEGHLKNQKSVVHKGDVLVVRSGAPGIACVATENYDGCNAVDIIIAHPDVSKINPVFLAMFTNLPHGMNQIQERTGGAAQQHFNVGGYKDLNLIMPPLALQNKFALFFEQSSKSKLTIQQSLDKLETLKNALMQQYFG